MKFSVIIPAYNAALYIKNSINSVLNQTISDFEILIVDDGSTDHTREIVLTFQDERLHYVYQINGGVSSARNTGISNAKGEYICFLDADDIWKSNHLAVVSQLIEKYPEVAVYLTGHEILMNDGRVISKRCPIVCGDLQSNNAFKHIWEYGYFFNTNSVVSKKSAIDAVGRFEVGVKNGEDDDMWYRLFSFFSVAISSEITTTYIRENSRATIKKTFVDDWVFLHRVDKIMASNDVSDEKKDYLRRILEQRKLSFVRYCILIGDKKTAWEQMKTIDKRLLKKKKYIETMAALAIPSAWSRFMITKRDRHYYGK